MFVVFKLKFVPISIRHTNLKNKCIFADEKFHSDSLIQDTQNEEKRNSIQSDGAESTEASDLRTNKDESTEKPDVNIKSSAKP